MASQDISQMDLSQIPLAPNPSGAPPNFIDPPTLIDSAFGTGVALIVVAGVLLALRLGTNVKLAKRVCLDDILCICAFAGTIAYWYLNLLNSEQGLARHMWDIPLSTFTIAVMQRQTAIMFLAAFTQWAAKSAILALYIRIFGSITWLRRTAWTAIVVIGLFFSLNIVAAGAYCVPRKGEAWGGASFARCSSSAWIHVVVGVFAVLADILLLTLPFPVVMNLRISVVKKITLGFVFGTGIILVVLSVVSLWLRVIIFQGKDQTWNATLLEIVTVIEMFGTVAVSCAPAMSACWLKIFTQTRLWSDLRSSSLFSYFKTQSRSSRQSSQEKSDSDPPHWAAVSRSSKSEKESAHDSTRILREVRYEIRETGAIGQSGPTVSAQAV
ncbi:hypothetical protein IQ07DRAFT_559534 [Pyrenochaeta sp. DS3sAY3a]|nr:hypothetical protein IQ07DRAFT_559534 [Pyrenochaeta sp. DS3sAY3a]